ncbi:hypothetical protein EMIT0196MI5_70128 [Pseudomonas sp. IT-196MI5]
MHLVNAGAEQNNNYFGGLLLSARRSVGWMSEIFESFSVLLVGLSDGGICRTHYSVKSHHILLPVAQS